MFIVRHLVIQAYLELLRTMVSSVPLIETRLKFEAQVLMVFLLTFLFLLVLVLVLVGLCS